MHVFLGPISGHFYVIWAMDLCTSGNCSRRDDLAETTQNWLETTLFRGETTHYWGSQILVRGDDPLFDRNDPVLERNDPRGFFPFFVDSSFQHLAGHFLVRCRHRPTAAASQHAALPSVG